MRLHAESCERLFACTCQRVHSVRGAQHIGKPLASQEEVTSRQELTRTAIRTSMTCTA